MNIEKQHKHKNLHEYKKLNEHKLQATCSMTADMQQSSFVGYFNSVISL